MGSDPDEVGVVQNLELGLHLGFFAWLFAQAQGAQQVVHHHVSHRLACFSRATPNVWQQRYLVPAVGCKQCMGRMDLCKFAEIIARG